MASLDSGQSGFLQQEDAGNQVGFAPSGLLPPSIYPSVSLARGRACSCRASSCRCLCQSMCFTLEKGVLLHSCVKVSGNNTLAHSASLVPLSFTGTEVIEGC